MGATAVYLGGMAVTQLAKGDQGTARQRLGVTPAGQKLLAEHPELFAEDAQKTPPIPTLTPADAQQAASDAGNAMKAQLRKNQGRMSTILTGPMGVTSNPANFQAKSLLGQ